MPLIEYMLLAILGSSPAAPTEGTPSMRTTTAEAVSQPSGDAEGNLDLAAPIALAARDTGGSTAVANRGTTGKKPQKITWRRHRKHHYKLLRGTTTRNTAR